MHYMELSIIFQFIFIYALNMEIVYERYKKQPDKFVARRN